MKLAFAVAAYLESDIMILDEIAGSRRYEISEEMSG